VEIMAVTPTAVSRDLILVMDNGIGASGQPLTIDRTFKNVKMAAVDQDLYDVAGIIISLQDSDNVAIQRRDIYELTAE